MSFRLVPKPVILNDLERRNGRYIALYSLNLVNLRCRKRSVAELMQESIVFLVRVQCRRKESSRSLSHLLMSFLFCICAASFEYSHKNTLLCRMLLLELLSFIFVFGRIRSSFRFRFGFGPKIKCHFLPVFVFGRKRKICFRSVSTVVTLALSCKREINTSQKYSMC